jgi:hypothetical protein
MNCVPSRGADHRKEKNRSMFLNMFLRKRRMMKKKLPNGKQES